MKYVITAIHCAAGFALGVLLHRMGYSFRTPEYWGVVAIVGVMILSSIELYGVDHENS